MRLSVLEQHRGSNRDGGARQLEADPRATGHRNQAAPIGIAAVDRRFHQRGIRNRLRRAPRIVGRPRAGDADRHQLGRAFAASNDGEREVEAHGADRADECRVARLADGGAARAVREQHHGVVGRALAVDGDRVERIVHRFAQGAVEQRRRHGRIRRHEGEHRGQHRLDHARPLRHAADDDVAPADGRARGRFFREWIGGHDRARRRGTLVGGEGVKRCGQALADFLNRQRHADDARRCDEHLLGRAADECRRVFRHFPGDAHRQP